MAACNIVCQQNPFLSVSFLEKYLPSTPLQTPLPPLIHNTLSSFYIGFLVLCAMAFSGWMLDWRDPHESCVDEKIRIVFPDHRKRKEYLLKKIEEMDALERRVRDDEVRRQLLTQILRDAVQLERDYEALVIEGDK